jgi:anti-sigma-K factor RskA
MTSDNQHLEFLISQYVDQTLDAPDRRLIEQRIATDPVAGRLFKDQRDIQEVLDEWGNRLPMINWDQFDRTLAARLQQEVKVESPIARNARPWGRALAMAAALVVAATLGYAWHAVNVTNPGLGQPQASVADTNSPLHSVAVDRPAATGPSLDTVTYEQPLLAQGSGKVQFQSAPGENKLNADHIAMAPRNAVNHTGVSGSVVGSAVEGPAKSEHTDAVPSSF